MKLSDFNFDLPEHLIALRPARPRVFARLLVAGPNGIQDDHVTDLPRHLRAGDRLVLNNTKVMAARLNGERHRLGAQGPTCARIEVTLLSPETDGRWRAMIKPLKKVVIGEIIVFSDSYQAKLIDKSDGQAVLEFTQSEGSFDANLAQHGTLPLPPYIASKRAVDDQDSHDYQTVFAQNTGAVAAPTASLHFDHDLLARLKSMGVDISYVTLHVGAGTFLPVTADDISDHKMHAEWGHVSLEAANEIAQTKANGGRVIPVGTTALRLIETASRGGEIAPWQGETDIFIRPGFEFHATDALMTNFHLPKSTLMMLVSAVMGAKPIRQIYAHAIAQNYRFFSYGDASLLLPKG